MTREDKDLLLKDLCARLPYGVKVDIPDLFVSTKNNIEVLKEIFCGDDGEFRCNDSGMLIKHVKPYLFPLSSMTEEQKEELNRVTNGKFNASYSYIDNCKPRNWNEWGTTEYNWIRHCDVDLLQVWLNQNHFDYRGLIPKGSAIDCTNLNIY